MEKVPKNNLSIRIKPGVFSRPTPFLRWFAAFKRFNLIISSEQTNGQNQPVTRSICLEN